MVIDSLLQNINISVFCPVKDNSYLSRGLRERNYFENDIRNAYFKYLVKEFDRAIDIVEMDELRYAMDTPVNNKRTDFDTYLKIYLEDKNAVAELFLNSNFGDADSMGCRAYTGSPEKYILHEKMSNQKLIFDIKHVSFVDLSKLENSKVTCSLYDKYGEAPIPEEKWMKELKLGPNINLTMEQGSQLKDKFLPKISVKDYLRSLKVTNSTIRNDFIYKVKNDIDLSGIRVQNNVAIDLTSENSSIEISECKFLDKQNKVSLSAYHSVSLYSNLYTMGELFLDKIDATVFNVREGVWDYRYNNKAVLHINELTTGSMIFSNFAEIHIHKLIVKPSAPKLTFTWTKSDREEFNNNLGVNIYIDEIDLQGRDIILDSRVFMNIYVGGIKLQKGKNIKNALLTKQVTSMDSKNEFVKNSTKSSKLAGKSFCITGKLNHFSKRQELVNIITDNGGIFIGGITNGLSYLITNTPNSESSKNKDADYFKVPKITEDEFLEMVGLKQ